MNVFDTYASNTSETLMVAQELYEKKLSPLWVAVCSYYTMFYATSAFIYKKGYKDQHTIVHQVINETLLTVGSAALEKHFLKEYEEEKSEALSLSSNLLTEYGYE